MKISNVTDVGLESQKFCFCFCPTSEEVREMVTLLTLYNAIHGG